MTDRDDLRFDPDGFLDMDQFEAEDLDPETYDALRDKLIGADVPTPSAERFDEWIDHAVEAAPDAPEADELVPDHSASHDTPAPLDAPWEDVPAPDHDSGDDLDDLDGLDDAPDDDPGDGLT